MILEILLVKMNNNSFYLNPPGPLYQGGRYYPSALNKKKNSFPYQWKLLISFDERINLLYHKEANVFQIRQYL